MDNTIVIWDMAEGRRINTIKGHAGTHPPTHPPNQCKQWLTMRRPHVNIITRARVGGAVR
jgi:hypothetical protein